jgi:HD-like signal output (HDOD) protein
MDIASRRKRILFVDDEPVLLELFQASFVSMADEWELIFADSGAEALRILAHTPCEVLVSDMRMPKMNGAQLLTEVMQRYPMTARFILSGYADQQQVAECVGAAHQFLLKPCNVDVLRATLQRVCSLDVFLKNDNLKRLAARLSVVPSLPTLYFQVLRELQSSQPSIERLGQIVASDPGMTAKLLQLVNSAFFGFACPITHPTEAIGMLGINTVRSLALSIHAFSCFDASSLGEASRDRLWTHSLRTGLVAQAIMRQLKVDKTMVEEAFIGGLLHDLGKLMLVSNMPAEYRKVIEMASRRQDNSRPAEATSVCDAEREIFGATHADVGAYLLGLWGLTAPIVEAVALHHTPSRSICSNISPLAVVHVANSLEHDLFGSVFDSGPEPLDTDYLDKIKLLARVELWRANSALIFSELAA